MTPSQKILSENRNNDAAIERLSEALDDMAIALSAAQRAEVAPQWQPMETAPKDRSEKNPTYPRILLRFDEGQMAVAYWDAYYAEGGHGHEGRWLGWVEPCSGDVVELHYDKPTHWMPLPSGDMNSPRSEE